MSDIVIDNNMDRLFPELIRFVCTDRADTVGALSEEDYKRLYTLAKAHDLAHLVYYALQKKQMLPKNEEIAAAFKKQYDLAVFRYASRSVATQQLRALLEEADIPFIPLKGAVLSDCYPEPWMRTSSDVDLLVKEEDLERAGDVLEKAGYAYLCKSAHDVSYMSPRRVHVELHHTLIEEFRYPKTAEILGRVWSYALPREGCRAERALKDEMFYYYHVAHMVKHFESGGCGVRPFIDLWLLNRAPESDRAKRRALLEEGRIEAFADFAGKLSEIWFSGAEDDGSLETMKRYVLSGGVYGTVGQSVAARRKKSGKKGVKYYFSRVFPPKEEMIGRYPVLKEKPALMPFYRIRRMASLLKPSTRKRAAAEVRSERKYDEENAERIAEMMRQLEIW